MAIILTLDGPKGIGKTSILKDAKAKYQSLHPDEDVRIEHFGTERPITKNDYEVMTNTDTKFFVDRGMLSYTIYGFLYDSVPKFETQATFGHIMIHSWAPFTLKDYQSYCLNNPSSKFYILFAEDDTLLQHNIKKRVLSIGKGMTETEASFLQCSNRLFEGYAKSLQIALPEYVHTYRVSDEASLDKIHQQIVDSIK